MFQVQDLLDLDEELWAADPGTDRINVPGTVTDQNWTWRMPVSVEELSRRTGLSKKIRTLADGRRQAAVTGNIG
jgi:4-alpha-glucanotransferase